MRFTADEEDGYVWSALRTRFLIPLVSRGVSKENNLAAEYLRTVVEARNSDSGESVENTRRMTCAVTYNSLRKF